jgi:hypothetical protein
MSLTCPKCRRTFDKGWGTHYKWCVKREDHFWSYVNKDGPKGCWLYTGTLSFEGYGYVNTGMGVRRKQWQAHRFAWTLLRGEIPKGLCVLHTCDVRNCVNPEHLYVGTRMDNKRDQIARRRFNGSDLTIEEVAAIKALLPTWKRGMGKALAEKYGVGEGVITDIKHGNTFRHVQPSAALLPEGERK